MKTGTKLLTYEPLERYYYGERNPWQTINAGEAYQVRDCKSESCLERAIHSVLR